MQTPNEVIKKLMDEIETRELEMKNVKLNSRIRAAKSFLVGVGLTLVTMIAVQSAKSILDTDVVEA